MKRIVCMVVALSTTFSFTTLSAQINRSERRAALEVIERNFPQLAPLVEIRSADRSECGDSFGQRIDNGRLVVSGSSAVAACRGVYDFLRTNQLGISSWTGNRLSLDSDRLSDSMQTRSVTSPFAHHYYFNVVTYGYSMPYWDWERWEREIDFMALHGIDMPLALVANEAISERVWRKLGLTDEEIANYFVGPAHLPWLRMGNISELDAPLPQSWHTDQIALQHKILDRMRSLGMKPVCPGFAGFVPKAFERLYPDVKITETKWGGAFHNYMLSPDEELFVTVGKMFIEEWEREFGRNDYYIVDSFNEMDIPFPPKDDPSRYTLLASYGRKVYSSIKAGNKDAVWVMQGWMFGYQRDIWDSNTLKALLSSVPDDKMLLLDLAVDYNRCFWHSEVNWEFYDGFFGKPWTYSVIPNMGGKSAPTGILSFYANAHLDALRSPNRGRLEAFGFAPEGIENNEVIYELLSDAGWSSTPIDLDKWLENYTRCRYGCWDSRFASFWDDLRSSVYGSFTDHPRFNWQLRPGLARRGSVDMSERLFAAIDTLAAIAPTLKGNRLFEYDLCEWAVVAAGAKAELLTVRIEEAYTTGDRAKAEELEEHFCRLLEGMDRLLADHPVKDMARWIGFARAHGGNDRALADYYERNARRIVTVWGPPVDDYSARLWSGLIRDYYLPRWKHYFEQKLSGTEFDFAAWERDWCEQRKGLSQAKPCDDYTTLALQLIADADSVVIDSVVPDADSVVSDDR